MSDLHTLSQVLGHSFSNDSLLQHALSHRSARGEDNERLEFLGDAVLGLIIGEYLFSQHPKADEGQLSRVRAQLVCKDTLSRVASELKLGKYLRLGPGELKSGGQQRDSILADALEAIIAAIYLDANFTAARTCVLNWFANQLRHIDMDKVNKDAKTRLQEYLQARKQPLPVYDVLAAEGPKHNQIFLVKCTVVKLNQEVIGRGGSRRKAEQKAAEALLHKLQNEENHDKN